MDKCIKYEEKGEQGEVNRMKCIFIFISNSDTFLISFSYLSNPCSWESAESDELILNNTTLNLISSGIIIVIIFHL